MSQWYWSEYLACSCCGAPPVVVRDGDWVCKASLLGLPLASIGGVTLPQAEAVAGYSAMVTLSMASNIGPRKYFFA